MFSVQKWRKCLLLLALIGLEISTGLFAWRQSTLVAAQSVRDLPAQSIMIFSNGHRYRKLNNDASNNAYLISYDARNTLEWNQGCNRFWADSSQLISSWAQSGTQNIAEWLNSIGPGAYVGNGYLTSYNPAERNWLVNKTWGVGNELNENAVTWNGKVALISFSEWANFGRSLVCGNNPGCGIGWTRTIYSETTNQYVTRPPDSGTYSRSHSHVWLSTSEGSLKPTAQYAGMGIDWVEGTCGSCTSVPWASCCANLYPVTYLPPNITVDQPLQCGPSAYGSASNPYCLTDGTFHTCGSTCTAPRIDEIVSPNSTVGSSGSINDEFACNLQFEIKVTDPDINQTVYVDYALYNSTNTSAVTGWNRVGSVNTGSTGVNQALIKNTIDVRNWGIGDYYVRFRVFDNTGFIIADNSISVPIRKTPTHFTDQYGRDMYFFCYQDPGQTDTVNITSKRLRIEAWGAKGGGGAGGNGAYAKGELAVTNPTNFYLRAGGIGYTYVGQPSPTNCSTINGYTCSNDGASFYVNGGYNGGGRSGQSWSWNSDPEEWARCGFDGSNGGGGASDVRINSDSNNNRIIVAGGGGGATSGGSPGGAGGQTGSPGYGIAYNSNTNGVVLGDTWYQNPPYTRYSSGGRGGLSNSGGEGGATIGSCYSGTTTASTAKGRNGLFWQGGEGADLLLNNPGNVCSGIDNWSHAGAGGGGGYYGGGGGAAMIRRYDVTGQGAGGGGGSSFVNTSYFQSSSVVYKTGDNNNFGMVKFTQLEPGIIIDPRDSGGWRSCSTRVKVDIFAEGSGAYLVRNRYLWSSTALPNPDTIFGADCNLAGTDVGQTGIAATTFYLDAPLGANLLYICSINDVGMRNVRLSHFSNWYQYDNSSPVLAAANPNLAWQRSRYAINITATDTYSGLNGVWYKWDGDLNADCTGGTATTNNANLQNNLAEGQHQLYLCAKDNVIAKDSCPTHVTKWNATYRLDLTAPVVAYNHPYTNGVWYNSAYNSNNQGPILNAVDPVNSSNSTNGSGLKEVRYAVNPTPGVDVCTQGTLTTSGQRLPQPQEGSTIYRACATDNAGNTTTIDTTILIDKTAPAITIVGSDSQYFLENRAGTIKVTDNLSGVSEIRYAWITGNWTNPTYAQAGINEACTSGGTVIANNGTTTNAPKGGATLFVCARDKAQNVNNVADNNGTFNVWNYIVTISHNAGGVTDPVGQIGRNTGDNLSINLLPESSYVVHRIFLDGDSVPLTDEMLYQQPNGQFKLTNIQDSHTVYVEFIYDSYPPVTNMAAQTYETHTEVDFTNDLLWYSEDIMASISATDRVNDINLAGVKEIRYDLLSPDENGNLQSSSTNPLNDDCTGGTVFNPDSKFSPDGNYDPLDPPPLKTNPSNPNYGTGAYPRAKNEGISYLRYCAIDKINNVSQIAQAAWQIDKTAPTILVNDLNQEQINQLDQGYVNSYETPTIKIFDTAAQGRDQGAGVKAARYQWLYNPTNQTYSLDQLIAMSELDKDCTQGGTVMDNNELTNGIKTTAFPRGGAILLVCSVDQAQPAGNVAFLYQKFNTYSYIINALAGQGGAVHPSGETGKNQGQSLTIKVEQDLGYSIKSVFVDGRQIDMATEMKNGDTWREYTFNNINADHTLYAEFWKDSDRNPSGSNDNNSPSCTEIAPTGQAVIKNITQTNPTTVLISYDYPGGENLTDSFTVLYGTDSNNLNYSLIKYGNGSTREITISSLDPAATYYFVIYPNHNCAVGAASLIAGIKMGANKPWFSIDGNNGNVNSGVSSSESARRSKIADGGAVPKSGDSSGMILLIAAGGSFIAAAWLWKKFLS